MSRRRRDGIVDDVIDVSARRVVDDGEIAEVFGRFAGRLFQHRFAHHVDVDDVAKHFVFRYGRFEGAAFLIDDVIRREEPVECLRTVVDVVVYDDALRESVVVGQIRAARVHAVDDWGGKSALQITGCLRGGGLCVPGSPKKGTGGVRPPSSVIQLPAQGGKRTRRAAREKND